MSRKESRLNRFQKLVRPNRDAWMELRDGFSTLFSIGDVDLIYGLPESLIDALAQEVPSLFTNEELCFEQKLSELLRRQHSVGLVHGKLIRSSLFEERVAVKVSAEDFQALG